jgi:hypothetical protein
MPEIPKTLRKLQEARFFWGHMRMESARYPQPDREHFEFYLSAFLSAARSVTDFFERNQRLWWSQWKNHKDRSDDDRQLLNQMTKQRDNEVHEKGADVSHHMEDVPLSKIETPSGVLAAHAPASEPWGEVKVGLKVYYLTLGGKPVNALETCQRYLGSLERAVEEFSRV